MEKITLKPTVKELLHRNGEENAHFDVLSYQGAGNQERALGSLFVIGQIKYAEEDLSYAISLISSLAKREYYSNQSLQEQNAKKAFGHTLGKLNEVLDDFFKNKSLKLNIGLLSISGSDVYISRLGKLKIALARDGKYIDVLNNVDLFNKDAEGAKQFSNIISGKLHPRDKIFAYFPTRSITAREKQLNELFVKDSQEAFDQKIAHLAANANNFSCCGVHIDMREIKEIPVEARTTPVPLLDSEVQATGARTTETPPLRQAGLEAGQTRNEEEARKTKLTATTNDEKRAGVGTQTESIQSDAMPQESPRIIPAEFTITKRANLLTPLVGQFFKFRNLGRLGFRARLRGFLIIVAIVMLPLTIIVIYRSLGPSGEVKNAINKASENLRLAQSRLNQSNIKEARSLLQAALSNATGLSDKKIEKIRGEINQTLGGINRVSDKQPQLYFDPASGKNDFKATLIAISANLVSAVNPAGSIFSLNQNGASELAQFKTDPKFLFNTKSTVSVFNGSDNFGVYGLESKKTNLYSLKESATAIDAILYENNLYALADNYIYKYADAATGGVKRTVWSSDSSSGSLITITADGNIYALSSDGKLIKYFKGKKAGEFDLQLIPTSSSRIFTFKDSAFLYLADKTNGLVYVFDKATGELKTTYNLSAVYAISDISISPDGAVWILSADNKVWVIR